MLFSLKTAAVAALTLSSAFGSVLPDYVERAIRERGIPNHATGVKTIKSPSGAQIRYKEPGKDGVCETTEGVNSYSGYVDLDEKTHMFFWFFEARKDPETAPITLWLNGGPGSDSLIGLFQELGPCSITEDLESKVNPYAWNEVSNMLFLSQPLGVGFSYEYEEVGSVNETSGLVIPDKPDGRYSNVDPYRFDTTMLAAKGCWEILQGFLSNLPQLDSKIKSRNFNLWTESYGGHYGPAFYRYFTEQNQKIADGKCGGVKLDMNSLGIGNGIINERIQAPYYPEFARHNTYGIEAVNETVYNFMKMVYYFPEGCRDSIDYCYEQDLATPDGKSACAQATTMCRNLVESPYYEVSGRGVYDIRHPLDDPTPPTYFINYLNQSKIQNALGVEVNYTSDSSTPVFLGFDSTGDFVYPDFKSDLEEIVNSGVRVHLFYGDADYICNWFGGEAISLALNITNAEKFAAAGYAPFMVDGKEYGEVRQHGNFSFTRVYEAGHEVPFYQPKAALELFRRTLFDLDVATGKERLTPDYDTEGGAKATHTEPFVALPSTTAAGSQSSAAASAPARFEGRL